MAVWSADTRQHLWPGPLFLLKRPATFNSAVCGPSHQKCNSHPGQTNTHRTFPRSIQRPYSSHAVSLFYSFVLHLSFSSAYRQMRFTLFTFFTLYPQDNQVSSSSVCDSQVVQTEIKKQKGIKSITTHTHACTHSPSLWSWPCMQAPTITEETLRLLFGEMGTIWMFVVCALWWRDICGLDSRIKGWLRGGSKKLGWVFLFLPPKEIGFFPKVFSAFFLMRKMYSVIHLKNWFQQRRYANAKILDTSPSDLLSEEPSTLVCVTQSLHCVM